MTASHDTPNTQRAARLRDTLDMNRKVCRELKEAVENCVKANGEECSTKQTTEDVQPSN